VCVCVFVYFQFAANVLNFIDFNCCIAKTIDYNAMRQTKDASSSNNKERKGEGVKEKKGGESAGVVTGGT